MKAKTILRLVLWTIVIACGIYGVVCLYNGECLRKQYWAEFYAVPCEFRLDATKASHIKIPFHHYFEGLHGLALCIRKNDFMENDFKLENAGFMRFSLLDDDKVIIEGDNKTPCKEVCLEDQTSTDQPFAWLCRLSPHIPHKDYILDVEVTMPRSEVFFADLPIVVRYNPCIMQKARAYVVYCIGIVLCLSALIFGGSMIWHGKHSVGGK